MTWVCIPSTYFQVRVEKGKQIQLSMVARYKAGGSLNPDWVEWLMGWPLGWTDLKPLEMGKFQQWLRLHGVSSEDQ